MLIIGMTSWLAKILVRNNTLDTIHFPRVAIKRHIIYSKVYPYFSLETVTSSDSLKVILANRGISGQEQRATGRSDCKQVSLNQSAWQSGCELRKRGSEGQQKTGLPQQRTQWPPEAK